MANGFLDSFCSHKMAIMMTAVRKWRHSKLLFTSTTLRVFNDRKSKWQHLSFLVAMLQGGIYHIISSYIPDKGLWHNIKPFLTFSFECVTISSVSYILVFMCYMMQGQTHSFINQCPTSFNQYKWPTSFNQCKWPTSFNQYKWLNGQSNKK